MLDTITCTVVAFLMFFGAYHIGRYVVTEDWTPQNTVQNTLLSGFVVALVGIGVYMLIMAVALV